MPTELPHADLLAEILAFCETNGVAKTIFGLRSVNDASFVTDLEQGRECRRSTVARVRQFMQSADAPEAGAA